MFSPIAPPGRRRAGQGPGPGRGAPVRRLKALVARTARLEAPLLVVGLGNEMLGDDGVGCAIARDLEGLEPSGLVAVPVGVALENAGHLVRRHRPGALVVVDAATGLGRRPWAFVAWERLDTFCHSTHSVPLSLLVAAWRAEAPALEAHFLGVAIGRTAGHSGLSPAVAGAARQIVAAIRGALGAGPGGGRKLEHLDE